MEIDWTRIMMELQQGIITLSYRVTLLEWSEDMNDKLKETMIGLTKAGLSTIPVAGGLLNEIIFDIRGRIVQDRINGFVKGFEAYINELGIEIDDNVLTSEMFNDICISILKRVADTSNEAKLQIFRDILCSNISAPYDSDFRETFLDLVSKLDHIEIEILKLYEFTGRSGSLDIPEGAAGAVSVLTVQTAKTAILEIIKGYIPDLTTIEREGRYEFYICDLISKTLLIDSKSIGNTWGTNQSEGLLQLYITDFGKEFLKYIRNG